MSANGDDGEDQGGAGRREVAYRLFAAEFEDADFSYSESDEERAPNYVVTPTGARVNRVFVVGVLTEVENASEDVLRARVVDPTGAFVVYAGQYQPDAQAFFDRAETPSFVAVTGKARTFEPEDSDVTYTSVRPENVNEVDAETRDRWTLQAVRQTLARVSTMADALGMDERGEDLRHALESRGVDVGLAAGIPLAIDHYGTTPAYLDAVRETAVSAAEVVADERDEVVPLTANPDAPGEADLAALSTVDVPASVAGESTDAVGGTSDDPSAGASEGTATETGDEPVTATGESDTATGSVESGSAVSESESGVETATADDSEPAETDSSGGTDVGTEPAEAASATTTAGSGDATSTTQATESAVDGTGDTATSDESAEVPASDESAEVTASDESAEATTTDDTTEATASDGAAGDASAGDDELGDFDPGEFELGEEEREEIEEEFGPEFQSGTDVDPPGEADIDTPDPESEPGAEPTTAGDRDASPEGSEPAEPEPNEEAGPSSEPDQTEESESAEESEAAEDAEPPAEPDEDVDLDEAVMDAMEELDDGDGASEDDIVDAVTARTGAANEDVRDAIQDALMQGQCYEPDDGVFKPI